GRLSPAEGKDGHARGGGADRALALLGPVLVHHRHSDTHRRRPAGREQAAADVPPRAADGTRRVAAEPGMTPAGRPAGNTMRSWPDPAAPVVQQWPPWRPWSPHSPRRAVAPRPSPPTPQPTTPAPRRTPPRPALR